MTPAATSKTVRFTGRFARTRRRAAEPGSGKGGSDAGWCGGYTVLEITYD